AHAARAQEIEQLVLAKEETVVPAFQKSLALPIGQQSDLRQVRGDNVAVVGGRGASIAFQVRERLRQAGLVDQPAALDEFQKIADGELLHAVPVACHWVDRASTPSVAAQISHARTFALSTQTHQSIILSLTNLKSFFPYFCGDGGISPRLPPSPNSILVSHSEGAGAVACRREPSKSRYDFFLLLRAWLMT